MLQKKIYKIVISIISLFAITIVPCLADESNKIETEFAINFSPSFTYITSFTSDLQISSNGNAYISVFASSRSCDHIILKAFLQKYISGEWRTIESWSLNKTGTYVLLSENNVVLKGFQYRLLSKCEVYNTTNMIESESMTTDTQFY